MADLEDIYKKFFDESGNMKESGKKIVSEGMKGINKASAETYVSKAPAVKEFDKATKAGPKQYIPAGNILNPKRDVSGFDTKTLTEKGFFQPKSLKAAETIGKAAKATRIGKIAAGVAAAGYGVKKYLESKMSKPEVEDVEKKSKGGMNKYSTGKSVKGYGQARKSGMGLEDENISLGKGSDYIKDLL